MTEAGRVSGEEAIIQEYLAPLAQGFPGAFGLADDCALLGVEPGHELVVTTDALIEGVHFLAGDVPAFKALAVNVSDLAAKAAKPLAYLMTLALPEAPTRAWLEVFASELKRAQETFGCRLIGGDTDRTPGPLTVSIMAIGSVPVGGMVRRGTAHAGEAICVTGTIGDAALGLRLARDPATGEAWELTLAERTFLAERFHAPIPPVVLADVLRDYASAAIDVSDGLVKDLDRLCRASGVGARLHAEQVPLSAVARSVLGRKEVELPDLLTGGEDYETLFTVMPEKVAAMEIAAAAAGVAVTRIGEVAGEEGLIVLDASGRPMALPKGGWDHFA